MPVYYFHFRDSRGALRRDHVGSELSDDRAATVEAVLSSSELVKIGGSPWQNCAFEIHDGAGVLVETVPFSRH